MPPCPSSPVPDPAPPAPLPSPTANEVLIDFANDTHDCAAVQLQRDYDRNSGAIILLHPGESVTLLLDAGRCMPSHGGPKPALWEVYSHCTPSAGSVYKYAFKTRTRVANMT